jgi:hypothetical protein
MSMTRSELLGTLRANLDGENPGWRAALRRQMDEQEPGWTVATVKVMTEDGKAVKLALLANPERVPDPAEIDPATDPFRDLGPAA